MGVIEKKSKWKRKIDRSGNSYNDIMNDDCKKHISSLGGMHFVFFNIKI